MKRLHSTTGIRYLLLVFSGLGLSFSGAWSQDVSSNKVREKYDYLVYAPRDHSASQRAFPLVISLHGTSLKGNDLTMLKRYGLPQLVDQGKEYEFIIASPQCPLNRSWTSHNWLEPLLKSFRQSTGLIRNEFILRALVWGDMEPGKRRLPFRIFLPPLFPYVVGWTI